MFTLQIRDRIMIAHSLKGEVFGPAQQLHGATFIVDAAFIRPDLDSHDIVVDIGLAHQALAALLQQLNFRNLDDHPDFAGRRSTTEALARWVHQGLSRAIHAGGLGPEASGITALRITLHESDVALASFEAPVAAA